MTGGRTVKISPPSVSVRLPAPNLQGATAERGRGDRPHALTLALLVRTGPDPLVLVADTDAGSLERQGAGCTLDSLHESHATEGAMGLLGKAARESGLEVGGRGLRCRAAPLLAGLLLLAVTLALAPRGDAFVYWADSAVGPRFLDGSVGRANLDGSGVEHNFTFPADEPLDNPCGVAVDGAHIYWVNPTDTLGVVGRANLNGSGANPDFITAPGLTGCAVAVDGAHIYWANIIGDGVLRGGTPHFPATARPPPGGVRDRAGPRRSGRRRARLSLGPSLG